MAQTLELSPYVRNSRLVHRKYREFFFPTILMAMSITLSIVIDGIMVGSFVGADALAAVNLGLPLMQCLMMLASLLGMGSGILISIAKGRRDEEQGNVFFTTSVLSLVGVSGLLSVLGIVFLDPLCALLTQTPQLLPLVKDYVGGLLWGALPIVVIAGIVYSIRSDGQAVTASLILTSANMVNLLLDYVFMNTFHLGVRGAATATVLGYVFSVVVLARYLLSKKRTLRFQFSLLQKPGQILRAFRSILETGTPGALVSFLMAVKIYAVNMILQHSEGYTPIILSCFSVCIACLSMASMFIMGTTQTMIPLLGTFYGEKDGGGIRYLLGFSLMIASISVVFLVLCIELFPQHILKLYGISSRHDLIMGAKVLRIFAISLPATTLNYLGLSYFTTTGKKALANQISLLEGAVLTVLCAWLFSSMWGVNAVWYAYPVSEVTVIIITAFTLWIIRSRHPHRYTNMLLLDETDQEYHNILDLSVHATQGDAAGIAEHIQTFVQAGAITSGMAYKVALAAEEMVANMASFSKERERRTDADIRVRIVGEECLLVIRDDGPPFDPTTLPPWEEQKALTDGIHIVKAMASNIHYSRVLNMNQTVIALPLHRG